MWTHGGGFTEGDHEDTIYGPDFLLSADNVIVTIQYRVGIFGFLNLGTSEYSGNMGLKDQQLALKWVYENIEHFSGNKDKILLFGESAGISIRKCHLEIISKSSNEIILGGASVTFHMLNEISRKYFKRAFAMSGSIFSYFALTEGNHVNRIKECSNINNHDSLMEFLKTSASEILTQCHFTRDWGKTLKPEWTPTIEIPSAKNAFLTQSPDEIYNSAKAPVLDTLFSFTSQVLSNIFKRKFQFIFINQFKVIAKSF